MFKKLSISIGIYSVLVTTFCHWPLKVLIHKQEKTLLGLGIFLCPLCFYWFLSPPVLCLSVFQLCLYLGWAWVYRYIFESCTPLSKRERRDCSQTLSALPATPCQWAPVDFYCGDSPLAQCHCFHCSQQAFPALWLSCGPQQGWLLPTDSWGPHSEGLP